MSSSLGKPDQALVEALQESILDNPLANEYVDYYAKIALDHFQSQVGKITDPAYLEELRCQYQWHAWNRLFLAICQTH
jgi:hypothetical protein